MLPTQYTVDQVAEYFQRDARTIRRWIVEGKFPHAYRITDGWFIPETDVKRLVRQMQVESAGEMKPLAKTPKIIRPAAKGFVGGWK